MSAVITNPGAPGPAITGPDVPTGRAATQIAAEGSEQERIALASRANSAPEILYFLAGDEQLLVRAAVAANAASPAQADRLLAQDGDARVRALVGRKLAPRAPDLAAAADRLKVLAWTSLCALAADTAVMVRAVIAEELKAMPDAPRELILQLAQDAAMEVAGPVIRFSPLLTDADLLALVEAPPVPATVTAVARRPRLSEPLSDAVAARADDTAIAALLDNDSAAIREKTLDALIAQAAAKVDWQERLVRRSGLPSRATLALVSVVADHLLEPLATRLDLDPMLARVLRARIDLRLEGRQAKHLPPELAFEEAALHGDQGTMLRLLAEGAGIPAQAVEHAMRLRSAKALISLCWKAGFGQRCATLAQTVLAQIAPSAVIQPAADGGWPLSEAEMKWQIELLDDPD